MNLLLLAELRRIAARRLVRLIVVLAGIGIAVGGTVAFVSTSSLSEQAFQQRVGDAETRRDAQQVQTQECLRARGVSRGDDISEAIAKQCFSDPIRADDPRFRRTRLEGILEGMSGGLAVVGWALGASLIGAEFSSRSLTTVLTWETRRTRVFLAKIAAVAVATALLALAALVLTALALWPSLVLHGAPLRSHDPNLESLAGTLLRGAAVATMASGIGFAVATIGRNTAAALGAGFAYIIVFENILGTFIAHRRRWLPLGNAIVFISGRDDGGDVPNRSVEAAGAFLAAVTITLLLAALGTFRTRDIA